MKIAGSAERLADFLCRPLAEIEAWRHGVPIPRPILKALSSIVAARALAVEALGSRLLRHDFL